MAHPQYNQYQQNMHNMPQLQTQNQMQGQQRAYSPPSYQQSPGAMSPTGGGIPPAKRQRLSPQPASPYSQFPGSPFANSPYATSPPANPYLSLPHSPATAQPTPSFNQPQPYNHPNALDPRPPPQGSMPPPKVPYSKTQDTAELEKANPRDMDVNNISDVLTGSGIDLRAEEEAMYQLNVGSRNYGASFNSQASGSTLSPHGSFNQWGQQASHGAFQGTGPLSQPVTQQQQEAEFIRKHEQAARILNEADSNPLTDPFLFAAALRHRMAKRAYDHGISVNLEGLFDKIPESTPQNVSRTTMAGSNGESVVGLQASSLLNQNAPLVEILSLLSLAAEERVRTVVEDAFALSQSRQNTSDGIVPPSLADIAVSDGATTKTVVPVNISKTAWEAAPDSEVSPLTVTAQKHLPNAARLPTPPSEAPPTPQPTIQVTTNHVTNALKRRWDDDERFERERIAKRKKRLLGNSATPADTPTIAPLPGPPEKMTKKERDRISKMGQTEEVLHRKANETASMALGKKKKYSWMTGGGGGGGVASGASTPRLNTAVGGSTSGTATPAQPQVDRNLMARRREWAGGDFEGTSEGSKIQMRDLIHVLEHDGRERKTLAQILARLRTQYVDEKTVQDRKATTAAAR